MNEINRKEIIISETSLKNHDHHIGRLLGMLLLLFVMVLGGLYLWGSMIAVKEEQFVEREVTNAEPETPRAVADAHILETTSSSDELSAIEADLGSTRFDLIDSDLNTIEAELEAALIE